ncbi:SusC/RagA family TonB-linked outer membrane protein [Flagellimonas oceanensis]|uniref:SusC/RagA family TonB-linked outer membrane protein n=1 Tax=Flagellimonas oceanensis TaxID=2499163 RepID=UPI000F8E4206|nr:SusC/RagA family TonB-linked outer membrane protein [Allomuricauda oceanensis]
MRIKRMYLLWCMFLVPFVQYAQITVQGMVTDTATQDPLPGVSIIIKGTSQGTATDFDGNYLIEANMGDTLVFSYIGFQPKEVVVSGSTMNVTLDEDTTLLDEVVVIGYGTTTVEDATGSVSSITTEDFNKGAIVSTDQLLTGKTAGVRITNSGGQPDSAPNIRIRGGSSLTANNNPLIVIDGIPVDNTNPAGVNNPLTLVNPNDVESVSILKDASATAIYGSRASNGVVIITTKKGLTGEFKFNFSSNTTVSTVGKEIDMMDSNRFTRFIQEYHPQFTNYLGVDDPSTDAEDDLATTDVIEGRILSDTDWQDAIYRTAISFDHNFSARGSIFNSVPIRMSLGYTETQGLVKTSDYERITTSVKLTPRFLDDHLKVDFNAKGIMSKKNAIDEGGALGGAVNMDPTKPIYDTTADNRFGGYYQNTVLDGSFLSLDGQWNPVAILMQRYRPERVSKILANMELDYKMHFMPELRAVANIGVEASKAKVREEYTDNSLATYRQDDTAVDPADNYRFNPGVNYRENQDIVNKTLEAYLAYEKDLEGAITNFDVQAGYSYQNFRNDGNKEEYNYDTATGERFLVFDPQNPTNRYFNELNLQSFFGRGNINLYNKYLLTLSFRADASSLFSEENRWGYFPAAAFAWKIYEEDFMESAEFVNTLKLRLGWGRTGQQDITGAVGYYPSLPLFEAGSVTSQYLQGYALYSARPYNSDLTWEKAETYNAGLDFGLFQNNVLSGSFDIYYRTTSDLLATVPVAPGQALTSSFVKNVGETESKGFEVNFNVRALTKDNMSLEFYGNTSYNRAEVTNLEDVSRITASESGIPTGTGVNLAYHAVGYQPYSAWVFRQLYDTEGNPIHGAFADFNGDGTVDNDDRYYRSLRPNWTFGFGFNFNYGKFDLSSSFRGQFGGQVYNSRRLTSGWTESAIPNNSNSLSNVLDFYGGAADFNFVDVRGNVPFSDYYLEDATFLRCENIVLGYRLDDALPNVAMRFYGALNNPFIITKYDGQDPENFNAIDNNFYPRPRSFTFGVNVDF